MGSITSFLFNTITVIFLTLTLVVGLVVILVAAGTMEAPILAPANTLAPPTQWVGPTLTPSPGPPPEVTLTPVVTATPAS